MGGGGGGWWLVLNTENRLRQNVLIHQHDVVGYLVGFFIFVFGSNGFALE